MKWIELFLSRLVIRFYFWRLKRAMDRNKRIIKEQLNRKYSKLGYKGGRIEPLDKP